MRISSPRARTRVTAMATSVGEQDVSSKPHHPAAGFQFPTRSFGKTKVVHRSFQFTWFSQWPFLHYDEAKDVVYCHTCLMALKQERLMSKNADPAFVSKCNH